MEAVEGGHASHDTSRHVTTRHDTSRHVTTRHDTSRHVTTRHDTSRHVTTRHDTSRNDGREAKDFCVHRELFIRIEARARSRKVKHNRTQSGRRFTTDRRPATSHRGRGQPIGHASRQSTNCPTANVRGGERNGTETERNGLERNGLEQKGANVLTS